MFTKKMLSEELGVPVSTIDNFLFRAPVKIEATKKKNRLYFDKENADIIRRYVSDISCGGVKVVYGEKA